MTEESRYLSFFGKRVHFHVIRPDSPLRSRMLFLSSPTITTFHWRKLLPELAGLGCLAVLADLPGFGRCDPGSPQDPQVRSNLIWGVLDEVDRSLGTPMSMWHLAGHGTAAATILTMALQYPDSVRSQVYVCPQFSVDHAFRKPEARQRFFSTYIDSAGNFKKLIEDWSGYPMDDYVLDRMRAPLLRPGMARTFDRMLSASLTPPGQSLSFCPAMAIIGGRDPLTDAPRLRQIERLLPEAECHRLASAGHYPMETHSRALRDYLRGWLRYNDR
ncbi:MAG: alpha/beta fold hydrolase [Clostridia bacterium]|nr:alpha/beta fold hydrolase [Clostridia bacterium]